ncbi:MAG: hypothetical protein IPK00_24170, partial [Deltaproteobacteria bacterium]|nr:hypothetical protein [Deltaproteobacteria bacterium]
VIRSGCSAPLLASALLVPPAVIVLLEVRVLARDSLAAVEELSLCICRSCS